MWISRTYDKFHPGFPVKLSLPGLDFPVNLPKYSVDFQYHSLSKNMSSTVGGVWIIFGPAHCVCQ